MAYSDKVVDHYENPRNVGAFDKGDDSVGTGMVGAPACGDVMKLQIKVNPATGVIEDARFKTYGCGSAIASSSLVTEWVKGKTLDQALRHQEHQIAEELALPPVKIHCSILAEDAIKAAVDDYKHARGARGHAGRSERSASWRHPDRSGGAPRDALPRQARQGRGRAPGRQDHRLLRPGLQARVRRRGGARRRGLRGHGVKVLIDPKSLPYIDGTELDFVREGLNEGFKFNNPNEKDRCGCGDCSVAIISTCSACRGCSIDGPIAGIALPRTAGSSVHPDRFAISPGARAPPVDAVGDAVNEAYRLLRTPLTRGALPARTGRHRRRRREQHGHAGRLPDAADGVARGTGRGTRSA
jgi:nitrogen fixation NifU-like protein